MRIKLKYPDVETFIQKYSVNISRGGIFIATRTPKPVGTMVRFEFQIATAMPVIRGEGQVIWVKDFDPEQPKRVHGMGVRFTRLDSESRALVDLARAGPPEITARAPSQTSGGTPRTEAPPPEVTPLQPAPFGDAPPAMSEAVAELWQSSQSQIVRAARHIAELTKAHIYY